MNINARVKVNYNKWNQTPQILREEAIKANHRRTRERLLALYEITQGKTATQVSIEIKRRPNTVLDWLHAYNNKGLEALIYKKTGGRLPLFV